MVPVVKSVAWPVHFDNFKCLSRLPACQSSLIAVTVNLDIVFIMLWLTQNCSYECAVEALLSLIFFANVGVDTDQTVYSFV